MYAPSFFLALLAVLVVSTSAMPMSGHNAIHHLHKRAPALPKRAASSAHRKRTCKPKTSSAAASSVAPGTTKPVQSATKSGNEAIAHPTTVATSKAASTKAASSQTSSAADSTETSPAGVTSLIKALFPVSQPKSSFSTAAGSENKLPLSDATLRPLAAIKDLTHAYVQSPGDDSRLAMKAHYPKGSVALGHGSDGGISFYSPGPDSIDWTNAQEVTFGYSVLFPKGFDFNLGGKLFGLCACSFFIRACFVLTFAKTVVLTPIRHARALADVAIRRAGLSVSCSVRMVRASSTPTFPMSTTSPRT